jgi:hypothetical protein
MMRSLDLHETLLAKRQAAAGLAASEPQHPAASAGPPPQAEARPSAENVTPLALGDRKRGDP